MTSLPSQAIQLKRSGMNALTVFALPRRPAAAFFRSVLLIRPRASCLAITELLLPPRHSRGNSHVMNPGSVSQIARRRGRRTCPFGSGCASRSSSPRLIVERASPVILETRARPPLPHLSCRKQPPSPLAELRPYRFPSQPNRIFMRSGGFVGAGTRPAEEAPRN
jgi:hypothetical protein